MEKLNLRELKGAPLSIALTLAASEDRAASFAQLCAVTGCSDKSVNAGLDLLRERQIVTKTGHSRYQLTEGASWKN